MHLPIAPTRHAPEVNIAWPLRSLFHYVSDIDTYPVWQANVVDTEWRSHDRHVPGAYFLENRLVNGKREEHIVAIGRYVPFRERTHVEHKGNWKISTTLTFTELPESTVIGVEVVATTTEPLRWVSTMVAERIRQGWIENLLRLKTLLEGDQDETETPRQSSPSDEKSIIQPSNHDAYI